MMIVEVRLDDLLELIDEKMTLEELEEALFLIKSEIAKVDGNDIQIEVNPDRQDLLSAEGIARAVRAFIGKEVGLPKYSVTKSRKGVKVRRGLKKIREFISCGIVRGIPVNNDLIKDFMHLQELLTATHGRNRNLASIGLYILDDIKFPVIYETQNPARISFIPLGHESEMTGPDILAEHEKGIEFGHIIDGHKKWPLLTDSDGKILSLPPIINSNDLGRITESTENIFVEVTGTHLETVNQVLNIMITSLAERGGKIQSVEIEYPDGSVHQTPGLTPRSLEISLDEVKSLTGLELTGKQVIESLKKMCYDAKMVQSRVLVQVPSFRVDILHVVDIIEDIAIGYGFDKIEPSMPQTMTVGQLRQLTRLRNKVRDLMIGAGYQEIMSYVMTAPEKLSDKMLREEPFVSTSNPKSRDYSVLRNSLLPILIDFISQNQHADYPQRIFEVGDVVKPCQEAETRTIQTTCVSSLVADNKVNVTEMINDIAFLLRGMGLSGRFDLKSFNDPSFIRGRCASIIVDEKKVGIIGEISPQVLSNFEIRTPVVAFELDLPSSGLW